MDMAKPIIRFKGYQDDWEQRKFGDVGSVAMCKRIFKEQTSDEGEVPFYKIGTFGGVPDAFISRELFDEYKVKYPYPNKGDILISASGSIGRTVEFTGKNEYFQDSNIVWFKHGNEIDNSFLKVLYSVIEWSCEGSTIKRLYNDNFLKTEFMLPQIDEQKKIGTYFSTLDHLITLHQRKCDETKRLKKYMLQKMFPQNGEKVPEIRFSGFTDDWEQRKVCNITTSYSGGTPKSGYTEYYDGDIPFIRSGEIYSDKTELFITELGMKNSSAKMVHEGDILYALYGATSGEVSRAKLDGAINQAILAIVPNDDINANFLVEWFRKEKDKITDTYLQGGQGNLSAQIIKELEVTIPSYDEQNKIGLYFEQLNTLITLHQRELENLQNIKKFMLGKMFV